MATASFDRHGRSVPGCSTVPVFFYISRLINSLLFNIFILLPKPFSIINVLCQTLVNLK